MSWMYRSVVSLCMVAALAAGARGAEVPRPEHPQPQMVRGEWLNLNGTWEFAETDDDKAEYLGDAKYPDKITVPFCRESKLSGLERRGFIKNVWYRRTFTKPAEWKSQRLRLHIGACDWRTRVWVNGQLMGQHVGGQTPFFFDITPVLKDGENTVVIHAYDDTRSGLQALGKQAMSPQSEGCVYTRTTGLWQTVWLEGVGSSYIRNVRVDNDVPGSRILLQADVDGPCEGLTLKATASAGGKEVGSAETTADWRNGRLVVNLSEKHLWSHTDPFLYDLKLQVLRGGQVVDEVNSYFGLREVTIKGPAILINGKAVFQRTVLDQGFYPQGVWTAPTDEALKHDIEMSQAAGFNGARLHQKVFDPRFLYWADKLGYMVWGEYPNWGLNYNLPAIDGPVISEWNDIIRRDRNHPAIVGWCPFNETPGEAVRLQNIVVNLTRQLDPSRPVIDSSGWSHGLSDAEVMDAHDYDQNPASFRQRWTGAAPASALPARYGQTTKARVAQARIPFFVSEYGGIGWNPDGQGWGYGNNPKTLDEFYARFQGLTDALLDSAHFGFCYTQLTDVEQERNGIYTYDRKPKFDTKRIHDINAREANYEKTGGNGAAKAEPEQKPADKWTVLVGANPDGAAAKEWRYVIDAKPADNWASGDFDDSSWKSARGGFGAKGEAEGNIVTPWTGKDIWLRQAFESAGAVEKAMLAMHHDDEAEVYLNGKLIWKGEGWNDAYGGFEVTRAVKESIKAGKNVIAIHCHQNEGGQFIDAALLVQDGK